MMNALILVILQMNGSQDMMDGWGGYGMALMGIFWLLILTLVIVLIWFLVRKGSESKGRSADKSSLEILNRRYANGEIDEEQYQKMKKELTNL